MSILFPAGAQSKKLKVILKIVWRYELERVSVQDKLVPDGQTHTQSDTLSSYRSQKLNTQKLMLEVLEGHLFLVIFNKKVKKSEMY